MINPDSNDTAAFHVGDAPATRDYRALREGAGATALGERSMVRVSGEDRAVFLHGMSSNDMRGARAGSIVPALFLTEHAHLIADFFAWIEPGAILLDIDSALWTRVRAHLEKLLVADDVEFNELPAMAVLDIEGPCAAMAASAVAGSAAAALEQWSFARFGDLLAGNLPRLGSRAFTILMPAGELAASIARITALGDDFRAVGAAALEVIRVENGLALAGVDTAEKTIALEARLDRSISFSKGCYLGQETLERATARGGLRKRLYGLRIEGACAPEPGAAVMLAGKEVGRLSSVVRSPRLGVIGLAIVHHSAWDAAAALSITDPRGEIPARLCEIPFV